MRKIALHYTLDNAYAFINDRTIELKSAVIGFCADITRHFKIGLGIDLSEEMGESEQQRVLSRFPTFKSLSLEQLNKLRSILNMIRNINAHLYLCRPVYLDEDLKEFIEENAQPKYPIEKNRKITMYGMAMILGLFAQKYMVWTFITSFFRHDFFVEVGKGDVMSRFQSEQQEILNGICGHGKPIKQSNQRFSSPDELYVNGVLKQCLTHVFFDLEKYLFDYQIDSCYNAVSFSSMLVKKALFDEKLLSKVIQLRNCWFHGAAIGDIVETNGVEFEFTLQFAVDALKGVQDVVMSSGEDLGLVEKDINRFAQSFFNFSFLRLVEVSFKILDNRALTEDKVESRLENTSNIYPRIVEKDPYFFESLSELVTFESLRWNVGASKFLDKLPRVFDSSNLTIAKIHSDSGFTIGAFKTERKDIVLALVDLNPEFLNLVNGLDLRNYKAKTVKEFSRFISIKDITL